MRTLFRSTAILLVALIAACGGSTEPRTPDAGTVKFTRDANTCNGTPLVFTFYSDGAVLGTGTLASGGSQSFPVAAGSHFFSVSVTNTTLRFNNVSGIVAPGGTFSYLMTCS